ncbi:MAG: sulfatase-like hydrolase/transferase, partial [Proteobacteria bacterium]|nr:sulfatase-like hydrolase/transferase [Pseudomonadota bacterium]
MRKYFLAAVALFLVVGLTIVGVVGHRYSKRTGFAGPNVLIIVWDTVRADRMSLYGHSRPTTPKLEQIAAESVVFDRAISPAIWTVPSHASIFTGMSVTNHGTNVRHRWVDEKHLLMAEWFGANGYETWAFSANPNLGPHTVNLLQGFDTIHVSWRGVWGKKVLDVTKEKLIDRDRSTEISPSFAGGQVQDVAHYRWNAAPVSRLAFLSWLKKRRRSRPFLAYINMMEAHRPRVPTVHARDQAIGDPEQIELGLATEVTEYA